MRLTMLGAGSSAGTPVLGCQCATCTSSDSRNNRTRCSSLITLDNGKNILIDTSPDLRQQALREKVTHINAVLYTHSHADHLHGIDDLRAFCQIQRSQIPLYGDTNTMEHIATKFGYTLRDVTDFWDLPVLKTHVVDAPFEIGGQVIIPIPLKHGRADILGYRIGDIAYLTDVSEIPESSFSILAGVQILLLDCLRYSPHFTHIHLEQSLSYACRIQAKTTYLIHMTHELEYEKLTSLLPENVYVGYDGLSIEVG